MMKKKLIVIMVTTLILVSLVSGCASQMALAELRANAAAQGQGDILIGLAWPLAGNDGGLSQGVDLAVSEINNSGGIAGRHLSILPQDDEGSVTKGEAVAQAFSENKNVVAVIGNRNSFVSLPAAAIYEQAGLVMLTPGSTAPELTEQGFQYVFRSIPSDAEIARRVVDYARQHGHKRIAIYYSGDAYGRGLANAFEDSATKAGLTIVDRISYYGQLKQLADLAKKWQAMDYDGVFVANSLPDGGQFMADARQVGINVPFLAGNALDSPNLIKAAGQAAEGTVVGSFFNPQDGRPEVSKFEQAYRAKYGSTPGQWAATGYDAVNILAAAISRAESAEPAKIAAQLHALRDWSGVLGRHSFDQTGEEKGNLVVLKQVRKGTFVYLNGAQ
ncbi:MAG: ABC transporter substrate-binding protein [Desulfitobacteriaceae bacterium]